jgi:transcriptional regulator with XRE-family HTH domain
MAAARHRFVHMHTSDLDADQMITGAQTRAARALLGWSRAELAERSSLSHSSIQRVEAIDGISSMRADNLFRLQRAFERAGIIFLGPGENRSGGAGVRLRR